MVLFAVRKRCFVSVAAEGVPLPFPLSGDSAVSFSFLFFIVFPKWGFYLFLKLCVNFWCDCTEAVVVGALLLPRSSEVLHESAKPF